SLTETDPLPIDVAPVTLDRVVTELPHLPNWPSTKSFSVAVVDVDDRVSAATDAKHLSPRPRADRLIPPSKNSPCRYVSLPLLSRYGHGAVVPSVGLTMPQNRSAAVVETQLALADVARVRRFVSPHPPPALLQVGSQEYTVIVD